MQQLVFFGSHGASDTDHVLAAKLMGRIANQLRNKLAIGLEQVERQFQPALDAYIASGGKAQSSPGEEKATEEADAELKRDTQWEARSLFPFESYLPVLHMARTRGIPLVALGVER
ncbi:unnamed protein product [Choristocarpus tenellus]